MTDLLTTTRRTTGTVCSSIVIADDSADVRYLLGAALELDGRFDVVAEVGEATAALNAVVLRDPALLVVDLELGSGAARWLVEQVRLVGADTAVVVLAAEPSPRLEAEVLAAGAAAVIAKRDFTLGMLDALHDVAVRTAG